MASDAVQYAVLGLISSREAGIHGYQLKSEFDSLYGDFWALNYGQMYRTLDRLERAGYIEGFDQFQTGRPNRKVFRITKSGRRILDEWLVHPPNDQPRPLRDELSVKLLFLNETRFEEILTLIRSQRAMYLQHLSRLTKRRGKLGDDQDLFVADLLLRQADMRVRSDLAWLDLVESEVRQRFGGGPAKTR
jgi:DNA-binding PadR family transcriptional regulator